MMFQRYTRRVLVAALCVAAIAAKDVWSQATWHPDKNVEIIVPTGAGGTNDQLARLIQRTLQEKKLISVPALVLNKPGGNQSIAVLYLEQHAGDPHHLLYGTATIFTNQIAGLTKVGYKDLTPLALLLVDYTVITVKADSPMKGMRDLVDRLKGSPESISFGLVSRGGPNHLAVAQAMRSAGIDPKKLKLVVFKTNAQTVTAVMGGHIDAMVSSVSAAMPQTQAGNARMLAVAAPQRVGGALAKLPTMREQGIDATGISNWRTIFGTKGLTAAQTAFWQDALAKSVATPEWKQQLESNNVVPRFMSGRELSTWLDGEYNATRAVMADVGIVK